MRRCNDLCSKFYAASHGDNEEASKSFKLFRVESNANQWLKSKPIKINWFGGRGASSIIDWMDHPLFRQLFKVRNKKGVKSVKPMGNMLPPARDGGFQVVWIIRFRFFFSTILAAKPHQSKQECIFSCYWCTKKKYTSLWRWWWGWRCNVLSASLIDYDTRKT